MATALITLISFLIEIASASEVRFIPSYIPRSQLALVPLSMLRMLLVQGSHWVVNLMAEM